MPTRVPPINIGGINCTFAMPGGRLAIGESSGEGGPTTTLVLQCAWSDRWDLVRALRGTCVGTIGGFARTPPFLLPNNPLMSCTGVGEFEYIGSGAFADGSIYSALCKLPAHFSCVPWQFVDGDPQGQNDASGQGWTVTKLKPSAEIYQPSGGSYYLGPFPDGKPIDEATVGFLRANVEIQVTRKFLPSMGLAQFRDAISNKNFAAMTFADTTFLPGYVILMAIEASEPYFDCVGNPVMDYTCTYLARTVAKWDYLQDRSATWQLVNSKSDGSGVPPTGSYDFNTLPR
jgi:hypothetical protein